MWQLSHNSASLPCGIYWRFSTTPGYLWNIMFPITALLPKGISIFPDQPRRQFGWLTSAMCIVKTQQMFSPMSQYWNTTIMSNMVDWLPRCAWSTLLKLSLLPCHNIEILPLRLIRWINFPVVCIDIVVKPKQLYQSSEGRISHAKILKYYYKSKYNV